MKHEFNKENKYKQQLENYEAEYDLGDWEKFKVKLNTPKSVYSVPSLAKYFFVAGVAITSIFVALQWRKSSPLIPKAKPGITSVVNLKNLKGYSLKLNQVSISDGNSLSNHGQQNHLKSADSLKNMVSKTTINATTLSLSNTVKDTSQGKLLNTKNKCAPHGETESDYRIMGYANEINTHETNSDQNSFESDVTNENIKIINSNEKTSIYNPDSLAQNTTTSISSKYISKRNMHTLRENNGDLPERFIAINIGSGTMPTLALFDERFKSPLLMLSTSYLLRVTPSLFIDPYIGYFKSVNPDNNVSLPDEKRTAFLGGLKISYYYFLNDKIHMYAGASGGVYTVTLDKENKSFTMTNVGGHIGAKYYFLKNFGAYAEVGYGLTIFQGGISLKIITKRE